MPRAVSRFAVIMIAVLSMVACSEEEKKPVQASNTTPSLASEASGPVSGKTAFWAMYKSAYAWSKDAVPLKLESKNVPNVKNEAGDAAMWSATFGSNSRHEAIEITYAAVQTPDVIKGVNVGHPISWGGPTRSVMPFTGSDIVVDSDAAYKTGAKQAEAWLKEHPDKPVAFTLGNNPTTFARPVWLIQWGDNNKGGYRVFVDTKTGELAKGMK